MKHSYFSIVLLICAIFSLDTSAQLATHFNVVNGSGCSPVIAHFTDMSTGSPVRWHWKFDNLEPGDTSASQNPLWIYTATGYYNVMLITYNAAGASDTFVATNAVFVSPQPVVRFTTPDTVLVCPPHTVTFTNTSDTGGCTPHYTWYIDTSSSIHSANATYTFTHSGSYDITLDETDACGCNGYLTKPAYIKIDSAPVACYTVSNNTPCSPPASVCFHNCTSGATRYLWYFGDGGIDSVLNPCHTYTAAGSYTDSLVAYNAYGCETRFTNPSPVLAGHFAPGFTALSTVCINTATTFTDTTSGGALHHWHFSTLVADTSDAASPTHTFTTAGIYTVKDSVWNASGCAGTATKSILVNPVPVVSFSVSNTYRCMPNDTVNFTSTVTDAAGIATKRWRFGDVASGIYNLANSDSVHIYTSTGMYSPEVTVTDNNGCVTKDSITNDIKVEPPVVTLSVTKDSGCIPFTVNYSTAISPILTYITDSVTFGDGTASASTASGTHVYSTAGHFTIHHYYHLATGCYLSDSIRVSAGAHAVFSPTVSPSTACPNTLVFFNGNCPACTYATWNTTLGIINKDTTSVRYTTTGIKITSFIANSGGCVDTVKDTVSVIYSTASFTSAISSCASPLTYSFTNTSVAATGYTWSFGDGATSTATNPGHTYTAYGTYTVTLTDNDSGGHGCTNIFTQAITINTLPTTFSVNDSITCKLRSITFTGPLTTAGARYAQYTWKFGDGTSFTSTTGNTTTHSYSATGVYNDTLIIKNSNGCFDTLIKPGYIHIMASPSGGLTASPLAGCTPLTVNFSDLNTAYSGGSITSRHWLWNIGSTSVKGYGADTIHIYTQGTYQAVLIDSDNLGCTVMDTVTVQSTKLHAYFSSPDTLICNNIPVHFNDTNTYASYTWNFGDGSPSVLSTENDTTHIYTTGGIYTNTVIVVSLAGGPIPAGCADTMIRHNYIDISSNLVNVGFTLNDTFVNCPPLIGLATNTSSPLSAYTYQWKLGMDSTTVNSTAINPLYVYNYPGNYNITLIGTNTQGCEDSVKKSVHILGPTGVLSVSPDSGCIPSFPVTLTLTSTGTGVLDTAYTWSVPPYGVFNTVTPYLTQTYSDSGSWGPYVIIKSGGCNVIVHTTDTIRVMQPYVTVNEPGIICKYTAALLIGGGADTYTWYPASSLSCTNCDSTFASPVVTTTYTVTGHTRFGCTNMAVTTVTVDVPPEISISGNDSICTGTCDTLTVSGVTGPYVWAPAPAISCGMCGTVVFCPSSAQSYSVTGSDVNSCGDTAEFTIYPKALPSIAVSPSPVVICDGASATMTASGAAMYSWDPATSLSCSLCASPVVTAAASMNYTVTGTNASGCIGEATVAVTVNPLPAAGAISGMTTVCAGSEITLVDTASGGVWSSSDNAVATVSGSGEVTGISSGSAVISYNVTNGCGVATATSLITINPLPISGTITGTTVVCAGSVTNLSDTAAAGTWSSSENTVASVSNTGIVTAISAGTTNISYTITNGCGTSVSTAIVMVNPLPVAGVISGETTLCAGASSSLTDAAPGGTWASSDNAIATVNSSGNILGISMGSATISYSVTNSCGTAVATTIATVNPLPLAGSITGTTILCAGNITILSDSVTGGDWTSTDAAIATINSTGQVTAISAGSTLIGYTVTNVCGTAIANADFTVNPLPAGGEISGADSICVGTTVALSDTINGGTWSSSNILVATVSSSGSVTAITTGSVTVSYSITNSCGTAMATKMIQVNPQPFAGVITGTTTLCAGSITTLNDAAEDGTWSSSNTAIATVSGMGVVTGIAAGSTNVVYTVVNSCGTAIAIAVFTVHPLPVAGLISGAASICEGSTAPFTDSAVAGIWSSSNTEIATISSSGTVTGISVGVDTISYTVTNSCGTAITSKTVTINPLPVSGTITGSSTMCAGTEITLSDTSLSGVWSSSDNAVATISSSGKVTGISSGSTVISYNVTNSCGTAVATMSVTVNPLPFAGAILGITEFCIGNTTTLSDTSPGGTWSSENTSVATVSNTGIAAGIAADTVTIIYTVTNGCGTATAHKTITINPLPDAGTITGAATVCVSLTITLSDASTGGAWSSSHEDIATVSSSGAVTGISAGIVIISYTKVTACGTAFATIEVTVNPLPFAGNITGVSSICVDAATQLTDTAAGGIWSSLNNYLATVNTSGYITGSTAGTDTIEYTVTNSCGIADAAFPIVIEQAPVVHITTHPAAELCNNILYQNFGTDSSAPPGTEYTWNASNALIYAVGSGSQYCLISFNNPGSALIKLTASTLLAGCSYTDSMGITVDGDVAAIPQVIFYTPNELVCEDNTAESYQWGYDDKVTLDSTIIPGAVNMDYFISSPDFINKSYWVMTLHDGCLQKAYYNDPAGTPTLVTTVGASNLEINIYPNPADMAVNVKVSGISKSDVIGVVLFDMLGRRLQTLQTINGMVTINLSQVSPANYMVTISDNGVIIGSKTITKR